MGFGPFPFTRGSLGGLPILIHTHTHRYVCVCVFVSIITVLGLGNPETVPTSRYLSQAAS